MVHCFEAEQTLMTRFVKKLQEKKNTKGSYYSDIWVVHYTEDVASKAYTGWACKSINTQQATKEIKSLPEYERVAAIYEGMCNIGIQSAAVQNKGQAQVVQTMKTLAAEFIPCGEELASVVSEQVFSLDEWVSFMQVTPDICLEKEMQWPVD